ncbi:glycosyltransferase [Bradyrhizobium sp. 138]|uniref:glycosyltransferase family 2 protein n=1 Tax=Bradyrhizobium sp. 138 TaxID=2782615 RepID=UPI001FF99C75|nr:glycosyltransferase family 2 protein [Bradyrhizobium sp. 138]MCK1736554.1 glycosyltransferase [Bradyrhizobium sp. 138]
MKKLRVRSGTISWLRRRLPSPPIWTFQQYKPRPVVSQEIVPPTMRAPFPRVGIVTPAYNHAHFLRATIDSVLHQNYPALAHHVQDGGSLDGTVELLKSYGSRISWQSRADKGQGNAINLGFARMPGDIDIMAYLNSDDTLMPGAVAYVASFLQNNPAVDIVYGHRIVIDHNGQEIGRAVMPPHDALALKYIGYVPQETMFWRRRVWEAIGPIDETFRFALDWDFMIRAQRAGFKFARLPRFLGCFRVHTEQKTSAMLGVGLEEMEKIRIRENGHGITRADMRRFVFPFLAKQFVYHWLHRSGAIGY